MPYIFARTLICISLAIIASQLTACSSSPRPASQPHPTPTSISPASNAPAKPDTPSPSTLIARYTSTPIKIDGKLDEPVWQSAPAYTLHLAHKSNVPNFPSQETTHVRLAWDDNFFYVAAQAKDVDIVDNNTKDQQHLYSLADTLELFLKPVGRRWYWEFYGTPRAHKSTLFFLSRGRFGLNPWPFQPNSGHKVAATIQGTLNNPNDRDQGFIIEMAIPRKLLNRDNQYLHADDDTQTTPWLILIARYNYSAYSESFQAELSTIPKIIRPNFHIYEQWTALKLQR